MSPIPRLPISRCLSFPLLLLLLGGAVQPVRAGDHVDLIDFPYNEANWGRFYDLQDRLIADFDDICPDTYCEGTYSNYRALQLRCSVHAPSGTLQACALVVGAGELRVDPRNGELIADSHTWVCPAPLAPATPVEDFHAALAGRRPLLAPFPGTSESMHEAVFFCLP